MSADVENEGQTEQPQTGEVLDEGASTVALPCKLCGDGTMRQAVIRPYNQNVGIALAVIGVLCLVTGVLAGLGLLMAMFGAYFIAAKKKTWLCDNCDAIVERA